MLGCDFDPQGEQVYSVKWYKGGQEIFRYMPSNKLHPVAVFPRPGVTINEVRFGTVTEKSLELLIDHQLLHTQQPVLNNFLVWC